MLRTRRIKDAPEFASGIPALRARSTPRKTADREAKKRPAPEATTEDKKNSRHDALLPDEGYETLPPPKQDAEPKG